MGGGGVVSDSRAPRHAAVDLLLPLPTGQLYPQDPDPSLLGYPRVLGKSCLRSPQIPPVPYNRSVNVSSPPTVPSQDPHNRRSTRPPRNPPEQCSPGSAHPQPALLSVQSAREAKKPVPAPLTASSFLRAASLPRPAVRSPGPSPALPPAPRPCAPAPPPLPQRPPGYSELAERRQRAPPGPGGHCLLSSPNPPPHNRRRPTPGGGGNAPGERPGRAEAARPLPPGWPPPPPHLGRPGSRVPAPGERRRAPCAQQLGAVPLGLRWWAPRRSVPRPRPLRTTAAHPRDLEQRSSRALCSWVSTAAGGTWLRAPSTGFTKLRFPQQRRRLLWQAFFFFFLNEL